MISEQNRTAIKGYLEDFLQGLVDEHKVGGSRSSQSHDQIARNGYLKPFHEAMLPEEIRRINAFERSFSTRLGSTFEYCGFYIASQTHDIARRGYSVPGFEIPAIAAQRIEEMRAANEARGMQRHFSEMVREICTISGQDVVERPAIADLNFKSADGVNWFFAIKSPKPNKGQCLEVTSRLLTIQAIEAQLGEPCNTYFAMAYNPYGDRQNYSWPHAKRHLDLNDQVLLQEEFWDVVGKESNTYKELLAIY
jgi:Type II restriction endonuclease, TdeIII